MEQCLMKLLQLVKFLSDMHEKLLQLKGKASMFNSDKINELHAESWNCDVTPIKEDFQFEPKFTLDEAIKETIAWNLKNNYL